MKPWLPTSAPHCTLKQKPPDCLLQLWLTSLKKILLNLLGWHWLMNLINTCWSPVVTWRIVYSWARARIPSQSLPSMYYNTEVLRELIFGLIPVLCTGLEWPFQRCWTKTVLGYRGPRAMLAHTGFGHSNWKQVIGTELWKGLNLSS